MDIESKPASHEIRRFTCPSLLVIGGMSGPHTRLVQFLMAKV